MDKGSTDDIQIIGHPQTPMGNARDTFPEQLPRREIQMEILTNKPNRLGMHTN